MAELAEVQKQKTAFIKNTRENRIKQEEEELEKLLKEQTKEATQEEAPLEGKEFEGEPEPTTTEEKRWKKRYADLRRSQTQDKETIKELKAQLEQKTATDTNLPVNKEEMESFRKKNPAVARLIESLAKEMADEKFKELNTRMESYEETIREDKMLKSLRVIKEAHPDFDDIQDQDEFHDWAEEQPKWIQDALYENADDPRAVIRVLDLYKQDIQAKSKDKEAISLPKRGSKAAVKADPSESWFRESQVEKMSEKEFEENQEAIFAAMRNGEFIYDISGAAR